MRPHFIGNHPRLQELLPWFQRVNQVASFGVDGLTVYLDGMDYSRCLDIRDDFKVPAFHWRVGDSTDRVPAAILGVMSDSSTQNLIWLAKSLLEREVAHVIWVYAHEFRHFMQAKGAVNLGSMQAVLEKMHTIEGFSGVRTQLETPDDLDSELFAKAALKDIIGEDACSSYIAECRKSAQGDAYFSRLAELEANLAHAAAAIPVADSGTSRSP